MSLIVTAESSLSRWSSTVGKRWHTTRLNVEVSELRLWSAYLTQFAHTLMCCVTEGLKLFPWGSYGQHPLEQVQAGMSWIVFCINHLTQGCPVITCHLRKGRSCEKSSWETSLAAEDSAAPHKPRQTRCWPCPPSNAGNAASSDKASSLMSGSKTERAAARLTNKYWLALQRSPCVAVGFLLCAPLWQG